MRLKALRRPSQRSSKILFDVPYPPTLHHQTSQLSNHSAAVYKSHQPNSSDEENYETAGESIRHSISSDFTLESGILGYLHGDKNSSYERFPKSRMRTMDDRETKEPDSPFRLDFAEEVSSFSHGQIFTY